MSSEIAKIQAFGKWVKFVNSGNLKNPKNAEMLAKQKND